MRRFSIQGLPEATTVLWFAAFWFVAGGVYLLAMCAVGAVNHSLDSGCSPVCGP